MVPEGLVAILELEKDLRVVGQAHDGEEACRLYKELSPDILILDLRMPKKDGIEVVTELMSERPRPRIIILTHSAKAEDLRALAAGAKSYLLKGADPDQVCDTIREVFAGKSSLPGQRGVTAQPGRACPRQTPSKFRRPCANGADRRTRRPFIDPLANRR